MKHQRKANVSKLAVQSFVVAALAGGTTAFVSFDKSITLSVDGEARTVHTFGSTVGDVLNREGIEVGAHDTVAPSPSTRLTDGTRVAVRYGRPLALSIDGRKRQVWVTATKVEDALGQLGVRSDGAYVSASRSETIGREGLDLDVRTERFLTFLVDGQTVPVVTNAATVGDAIGEAGIQMGPQDRASVPLDAFPEHHSTISVLRVVGTQVLEEERIPFKVVRQADSTLFQGTERVITKGVPGLKRVRYAVETVNGETQAPQELDFETLKEPVTQVVKYGTKALPRSVAGAEALNWSALARCESSGNVKAVAPGGRYHGLYQFDTATWRRLGGSGVASQAPAAEQTYRAKLLFMKSGASPWPLCGRKLYS